MARNDDIESHIQARIRLAVGGPGSGVTVWRNNVGALRDERGRLVRYGLCPGSSDLIGLRRLEIGPEHIGRTVGQFVALEIKAAGGRVTPEQRRFLDVVAAAGGVAGVARSEAEAWELLR